MHEFHLVKDIFRDILKYAEKEEMKNISKVNLRVGEFTEINSEILKHYFKEQGKATALEHAEVAIEPGALRELRLLSIDGD